MMNQQKLPLITKFCSYSIALVFALFFIFVLCSCHRQPGIHPSQTKSQDTSVNVMTFNIPGWSRGDNQNTWENRLQIISGILTGHQADIVGFQEIQSFMLDDVRKALPQYSEIGVARDDGQTRGEYCAILYRNDRFRIFENESGTFWLSETPEVPGSRSWDTSFIRICTWARFIEINTGNGFYLYNTHLDVDSQWAREEGALLIVNRIQNRAFKDPFLLTGDLNAAEQEQTMQFLKGLSPLVRHSGEQATNPIPMVDTFRLLHPDLTNLTTRHDWTATREGNKIDYVFASKDIKVREAQILYDNMDGRYPSDHYPVIAGIIIP